MAAAYDYAAIHPLTAPGLQNPEFNLAKIVTSNWQDPPKRERKRINAYGEVVTDRPVVSG
jgi:hypothetical protein